jgi:enamine deaminase RidA (YjgF/YER057c/UK114 family)
MINPALVGRRPGPPFRRHGRIPGVWIRIVVSTTDDRTGNRRSRMARMAWWALLLLLVPSPGWGDEPITRLGEHPRLPLSAAVTADGLIYLSGVIAIDEDGRVSGDVRAQTRRVLDAHARTLAAAGSRMANVAKVFVYLQRRDDFQAMNEVYRTYWPADPPARTTIEAELPVAGALVEIAMIAIPDGRERTVVHPAGWARPALPYSYGIRSGNTLFLAGLVPRAADHAVVLGDVGTQTRVVLDRAGEILEAAGMTYADVVSSRVFITDAALFEGMNAAYRPYFPAALPARATVVARLNNPRYLVEITLVAVKAPSRRAITTPGPDGSRGRANPNFSSAIQVGQRLYLAGMLGVPPASGGDPRAETREALARLGRTLEAAGYDWAHVTDAVVYLTDMAAFPAMNEVYREALSRGFPARTTVGTGLVVPGAVVEIMLTAVK